MYRDYFDVAPEITIPPLPLLAVVALRRFSFYTFSPLQMLIRSLLYNCHPLAPGEQAMTSSQQMT